VHEVKFDGYRLQAHIQGVTATLYTRNGLDWTHRFGKALSSGAGCPMGKAVLDGEWSSR
jgi:bifunctional non-homologous end joining protein LigD